MFAEITKGIAIILVMLVILWFALADYRKERTGGYYDCTIASFAPDIPPKVKEACQRRHIYEQDGAEIAAQQKINKEHASPKR